MYRTVSTGGPAAAFSSLRFLLTLFLLPACRESVLAAQEIAVEQPDGTSIVDGGTVIFSSINVGTSATRTFTIRNVGNLPLTGLALSTDGTSTAEFSVGNLGQNALFPGGSTTFSVTFTPAAPRGYTAAIHIASNDFNENPFDINLTGIGTAPEISVQQAGNNLVDGASEVHFGNVLTGSSVTRTFTIRNNGNGALMGLALSRSGSTNFTTGTLSSTTLAAGMSMTFTVTFTPTATTTRTGTIRIASNDDDEDPFDINLTGAGVSGADLDDPDEDGIVNLMEHATASDPLAPSQPPGILVKDGDALEFFYTRSKAALGEVTLELEWSESLTGPWIALQGTSPAVLSDDGVIQQVVTTMAAGTMGRRFVRLRVTRI